MGRKRQRCRRPGSTGVIFIYRYNILQQVEGFEDIAVWTGLHHETIDGKGYPFGLHTSEINLGSRILLIADIYSTLLEDRPYRGGMTQSQTIDILNDMVKNNKWDAKIVNDLTNHADVDCTLVKKIFSMMPRFSRCYITAHH
jgi:HD-GYP domain-containing protein (c-di-GMP phosphodiesterase class II)